MVRFDEAFFQLLKSLDEKLAGSDGPYPTGVKLIYDRVYSLMRNLDGLTEDQFSQTSMDVLDDFNRAQHFFESMDSEAKRRNRIINNHTIFLSREFEKSLRKLGVEEISTKIGDEFDPQIHEAKSVVYDQEFKNETVIQIIRRGFRRATGAVIRFVQVIVGKLLKRTAPQD